MARIAVVRLASALALALVVTAVVALWQAAGLQSALDRIEAVAHARTQLISQLAADRSSDAVQSALRRLLFRSDRGYRTLEWRDRDGHVRARVTRPMSWGAPILAEEWERRLQGWWLSLGARSDRVALSRDGRSDGLLVITHRDPMGRRVHDSAVDWLRLLGIVGGVLGMSCLGLLAWLGQGLWVPSNAVRKRAAPGRDPSERDDSMATQRDAEPASAGGRSEWGGALAELGFGVMLVDSKRRVRYVNALAEQLTGWRGNEASGRLVYSVFHPLGADEQPLTTPAEQALSSGESQDAISFQLRSRQGSLQPVEAEAALLGQGTARMAMMLFRDVSARERVADQMRREMRLTQGVIDHLVEAVLSTSPDGIVRSANLRAQRMFGFRSNELIGAPISRLLPVPFMNSPSVRLTDFVAGAASGQQPRVVGWRKDSTTFPVELVVEPMSVDGAEGLVVIIRDVTERRRSENLSLRLGRLLDGATQEIYVFDAQSFLLVETNLRARQNLGFDSATLHRMTPLGLAPAMPRQAFETLLDNLRGGESESETLVVRHRRADGSEYPIRLTVQYSREEEPPVFLALGEPVEVPGNAEVSRPGSD